ARPGFAVAGGGSGGGSRWPPRRRGRADGGAGPDGPSRGARILRRAAGARSATALNRDTMEPRVHYVIVGIFVLLLGSAAIGISLWLAYGDVAYATRTFRIYMTESVAGLFVDAPVRYRGVQVGRVRGLTLV